MKTFIVLRVLMTLGGGILRLKEPLKQHSDQSRKDYFVRSKLEGALGTKGGPKTNKKRAVLNVDGGVIEGLNAAGNVMASPMGMNCGGAGGTLAPGMVFGFLAV